MEFIAEGFVKAVVLLLQGDAETWSAIVVTLRVTMLSMTASLLLGIPLGFLLGYQPFAGRRQIRMVVDTLLFLPTVFVGLLVYAFISSRGPLGEAGLLFTVPGIAVGQTILALPIVMSLAASATEETAGRLRVTLMSLGANRRQLFLTSLWETRQGIVAAGLVACGRVMTEVGISMMVGGNIKWHTRTITTAIALETNKGLFAMGIALGMVLMVIAFSVNLGAMLLKRK
ncbi:MAG: ABC transporter permease [Thermodesulfobacteriota bacterium]|nr:ABC transporter permease [Thermodesulfobacteriota bacterium]